jgi:hypothetical protein
MVFSVHYRKIVKKEVWLDLILLVNLAQFEIGHYQVEIFATYFEKFRLVFIFCLTNQETAVHFLDFEMLMLNDRDGLRKVLRFV